MIDLITWVVIIFLAVLIAISIAYPLHFLWKPIKKIIVSILALVVTNLIGFPFGFHIGLNLMTILFVSVLGAPGYTTLILLTVFL